MNDHQRITEVGKENAMIRVEALTRSAMIRRQRRSFLALLLDIDATYRQRRALAEMDAVRLDDIGLTKSEAVLEAQKPFWMA